MTARHATWCPNLQKMPLPMEHIRQHYILCKCCISMLGSIFSVERKKLFSKLLTLGITNIDAELLLKGSVDYNDGLNKEIFPFHS